MRLIGLMCGVFVAQLACDTKQGNLLSKFELCEQGQGDNSRSSWAKQEGGVSDGKGDCARWRRFPLPQHAGGGSVTC